MASITGEQMDVLDRLWDIFESITIRWGVLSLLAGFSTISDTKAHYDYIGKLKPTKISITRRDLKTVLGLRPILCGVKIDWRRVAVRSGLRDEIIDRAHHHDLAMLESRPVIRKIVPPESSSGSPSPTMTPVLE